MSCLYIVRDDFLWCKIYATPTSHEPGGSTSDNIVLVISGEKFFFCELISGGKLNSS
jgi:hypothetical protein